eukprot:CAMPEP_0172670256 /NCGR_PEP_ID=MMETSP1074-20121228/10188_1 /TAXON_ID=2916 /ORGANISM="Ceratium fusus, Strain PA161109" /LENGTH=282 /DNA_ID=CAMNT_0013487137 /DNA_START=18 /DNA_END=863 /DNA_ORIENTATION=-
MASQVVELSQIDKVRHPDGSKTINGYRVGSLLGHGAFAKVKCCQEEGGSGETYALKIFKKLILRRQRDFIRDVEKGGMKIRTALDRVYDEVQLMKLLNHPRCVRLYAVFDEQSRSEGKLYLVLEHAAHGATMDWDSDRHSYVAPDGQTFLPEERARCYIRDALQGLEYLHSSTLRIAHRDIKPQNLLVDEEGRIKIADYGVAKVMADDFTIHGTEGTYYFYSPEMCQTGYVGHDGRRADVWALGVSFWAFVHGSVPFWHQDLLALLDSIAEPRLELPAGSTL